MLLVYLAGQTLLDNGPDADEIAYSEAKAIVEQRPETVKNVVFHRGSKTVELELTSGRNVEAGYPTELSALEFEKILDLQGIRHESRGGDSGDSAWWSALTYLLPFVLFGAFWIFMLRRGQGKGQDGRRGDVEGQGRGQDEDLGTDPRTYR